ncbi:hypothetical protein DPMN_022310 [Dreissena polymorpha]|uniref:Uncharacterized protein n=1 Tax=Dreissena polymorpha TaxID=45954 RepID=A0A9D4SA01_DREPO|nr:hypothetical protein DPMN_022310 [Dreissena polymorpha]
MATTSTTSLKNHQQKRHAKLKVHHRMFSHGHIILVYRRLNFMTCLRTWAISKRRAIGHMSEDLTQLAGQVDINIVLSLDPRIVRG